MSLGITLICQLPLIICSKTAFGAFGSMSLYACHTPGIITFVLLILRASGLVVRSCHTVERLPCRERWKGERPSWGRPDIRRTGTGSRRKVAKDKRRGYGKVVSP